MRIGHVFLSALLLAGATTACGPSTTGDPAGVSSESIPSSSSATTATTKAPVETPSPSVDISAPVVPPPTPSFVRCQLADGTGLMSDGSTIYLESCDESAGGPMVLEDGTSIYDQQPQMNPEDVPIADGGTCPAYRCGYGHDADGNPNPSSGEIQTKHGCDEGYITDAELCSAVNSKYDW